MSTPRFAGSDLKTRSCRSPTASKVTPTSHTATPSTVTAVSGFGVAPVTADSCSGNETNQVDEALQQKDLAHHLAERGIPQQGRVAGILPLADRLALYVPAQPQTPDRHQCQQQPTPGRVAVAERRGDGGDGHEAHAPRHVDDVVAADPPADSERDRMHHGEGQNRGAGYLGQILNRFMWFIRRPRVRTSTGRRPDSPTGTPPPNTPGTAPTSARTPRRNPSAPTASRCCVNRSRQSRRVSA